MAEMENKLDFSERIGRDGATMANMSLGANEFRGIKNIRKRKNGLYDA